MRRMLVVLAALALLGGACASPRARPVRPAAPASPASPSPAGQSARPTQSPAEAVPRELRFEAPLLSGGTVRGASYAGADLVIWFWAPW